MILGDVLEQLEEQGLEVIRLLLQSKVEVLRVQVVQPVDHLAQLGRNFLSQRFLRQVINDPDVLILLLRLQSEALILECYVFQLGLIDVDNDVIALVVLLHLGRHFGNLDTNDRRNLIVSVLRVHVNRHFLVAFFTLCPLFIFFTLGRRLFVFLARLAGWGAVWSAVQVDFGDPGRPQLLVADVAKLIILNRVNVPEALVDQIEDFGV